MGLTSHNHVTKPTAILSGKKCTVALQVRVYVRFVAMGKSCYAVGCTNRYEFKLLTFSGGTEQASKIDCSIKPKKLDA